MQFVNNWITQLQSGISASDTVLPLPSAALARLSDGDYLMTLVDSANPVQQSAWEIVQLKMSGGVATATRGQEATDAQAWPSETIIFCGLTAGTISGLLSAGSDGAAGVVSRMVSDLAVEVSLDWRSTTWAMPVEGSPTLHFPDGVAGSVLQIEVVAINQASAAVTIGTTGMDVMGDLSVPGASIAALGFWNVGGAWIIIRRDVTAIPGFS